MLGVAVPMRSSNNELQKTQKKTQHMMQKHLLPVYSTLLYSSFNDLLSSFSAPETCQLDFMIFWATSLLQSRANWKQWSLRDWECSFSVTRSFSTNLPLILWETQCHQPTIREFCGPFTALGIPTSQPIHGTPWGPKNTTEPWSSCRFWSSSLEVSCKEEVGEGSCGGFKNKKISYFIFRCPMIRWCTLW